MKNRLAFLAVVAVAAAAASAFGASDGNYHYQRQHCSGHADNVETPTYTEEGCHSGTITISDVGGHEYFGLGLQQTAVDEQGVIPPAIPFGLFSNVHQLDYWYDTGSGCHRGVIDLKTPGPPANGDCPWFNPTAPNYYGPSIAPDPKSGIKLYMGFDDNVAGGEHDSSELINNGPSDGGGIRLELDPSTIKPWLEAFVAANPQYILTHPLPVGDFGVGFCADSICIAVQTQRQVAYQGGNPDPNKHHSLANYSTHNWDPQPCSGDDDGSNDPACDDPTTPGQEDITYWHNQEGTVYAEPGVQIFADPDPQGSPIGPYPIPAIYVGTCGIVIGGGPRGQMPASPYTNSAGQIVFETGCG